jgi:hypothetical protein
VLALAPWIGLFDAMTLSIMTLSIMTQHNGLVMTLSIMGLVTTLSKNNFQHNSIECHYAVCRYAECHDYLNVGLNVIMLSVIRLNTPKDVKDAQLWAAVARIFAVNYASVNEP